MALAVALVVVATACPTRLWVVVVPVAVMALLAPTRSALDAVRVTVADSAASLVLIAPSAAVVVVVVDADRATRF